MFTLDQKVQPHPDVVDTIWAPKELSGSGSYSGKA